MEKKLRRVAENTLFALLVFILFFLLFENRINIPFWLQPIGRMHPLLLHFPIVILILAMVLEFFRFKTKYSTQEFYQSFTSSLLLGGTLLSAITVVMGLFLSKGGDYAGSVLAWHKWAGVSIVFVASFIIWSRNATWYRDRAAKAGALVTTFCIIFAGHYGAVLTHGDNFIFGPIMVQEANAVPLEQAVVFEHVIQPSFERKCVSCQNPDKLKGELLLTDAESILKGGKTGKFIVPGNPELSLLLKRVHLPVEDKKHMPPAGKTQLTSDEMALLRLWVKDNADFQRKVLELPTEDSLRVMAAALFAPAEEQYDFAAADEKVIRRLNTEYRVVSPLAKESPALAVNFFNKSAFTPQSLEELTEVKGQVVSLQLNSMPVKDADLKNISKLENLRKLNLSFTDITGQGIKELASLKQLRTLSLSGTKVDFPQLQEHIQSFKSLQTLAVWNTALTEDEISLLQKAYKHIQFIAGFKDDGSNLIKLNTPQVKNSSPVFSQALDLQLFHPIKGVDIRYTTDGTEPDSLHSPLFRNETVLDKTTTIKAKAFKEGWYGSKEAVFTLYRSTFKPDTVYLLSPLNRVHQANGANTFFDAQLGSFNANSPAWADNWAGFYKNNMEVAMEFKKPALMASVALNMLIESENNIFPPAAVEVWGGANKDQLQLLTTIKPDQPTTSEKPVIKLIAGEFKPQPVSYLKIIAKPIEGLPDWHRSKGRPALLLVDEILLN
ncbi:chitobiase/beta-hexosaminidase C-terminal domain-containing protein [soil metagenome]